MIWFDLITFLENHSYYFCFLRFVHYIRLHKRLLVDIFISAKAFGLCHFTKFIQPQQKPNRNHTLFCCLQAYSCRWWCWGVMSVAAAAAATLAAKSLPCIIQYGLYGSYVFAKFAFDYFTANRCSVLMPHKSFGKSIYTHQTPNLLLSGHSLAFSLYAYWAFLCVYILLQQNVFSLWRFHFDCLYTTTETDHFPRVPSKNTHTHTQGNKAINFLFFLSFFFVVTMYCMEKTFCSIERKLSIMRYWMLKWIPNCMVWYIYYDLPSIGRRKSGFSQFKSKPLY